MNLTYHVLLSPEQLPELSAWEAACGTFGFDLQFDPASLTRKLSEATFPLKVTYRGIAASCTVCTAPMSDVRDICDELGSHIAEDHTISVDLAFRDDQQFLPGISVIVGVLAKMTGGIVYTEGDGSFANGDEALEIARGW